MLQLILPSGRRLRFHIKCIGSGTFGTVYPGILDTDEEVAVKFARCSLELTSCLRHEIEVVSSLSHPGIMPLLESTVQVHSALAVGVYVMPRAAHSVQQLLDRHQPMDARRCAVEIFAALAYMHGEGWVHSDVTTMNILIMPDGQHRLADFGVTCRRGTPRAANSVTNEGCRAPECYAAHAADYPSDVWSAACVVAEMCCGIPVMYHTLMSGPLAHKLAFADTFRHGCVTLTDDPQMRALFVTCFQSVPAERATAQQIVSLFHQNP